MADAGGLHVALSACDDAQCLFAFVREGQHLELAGMLIYRRASTEEVIVVHVAVSDRFSNSGRRGLGLVIKMLRAVRMPESDKASSISTTSSIRCGRSNSIHGAALAPPA